jgi:antitoxin component YwqK of YwqJK toxin-antitoxin module
LWNGLRKEMYERGRKQGEWVEHVNDDRREGAYVDGDRDGRWIHFDSEGNIVFEGAYVAGIPTGEHVSYWPSGIREWIGSYKGGLRDGNWRYFDGAGGIRLIRQYEAGRIVKVNGAKTDR